MSSHQIPTSFRVHFVKPLGLGAGRSGSVGRHWRRSLVARVKRFSRVIVIRFDLQRGLLIIY
jgi:hypothetical protein